MANYLARETVEKIFSPVRFEEHAR